MPQRAKESPLFIYASFVDDDDDNNYLPQIQQSIFLLLLEIRVILDPYIICKSNYRSKD